MKVIKRNGLEEQFEWDKIRNVLDRAFKSVGETLTEDMYIDIIDELYFGDDKGILRESISVEELQDQLEQALFECGYFEVAKSFILYRDKHKQLRKQAQDNINFINKFVGSYNTADATIDDNSNVGTKGIGVLNAEIHKEDNIQNLSESGDNYMIIQNEDEMYLINKQTTDSLFIGSVSDYPTPCADWLSNDRKYFFLPSTRDC